MQYPVGTYKEEYLTLALPFTPKANPDNLITF